MVATSTRSENVYERLRTDILIGKLAAGSKLRVETLSRDYGASSGVIREALPRLVGQGLAVSLPRHGVSVVSIGAEDLRFLTEARVHIEVLVLRMAVRHGAIDWESRLLASHHELSRTEIHSSDGEVSQTWLTAHAQFHRALLEGCPNTRLKDLASTLRDSAEVYRCWSDKTGGADKRNIAEEHQRICDLALARDANAAAKALKDHIELTTDMILKSQSSSVPAT